MNKAYRFDCIPRRQIERPRRPDHTDLDLIPAREELLTHIAAEEVRLARLDAEREASCAKLEVLRKQLAGGVAPDSALTLLGQSTAPTTPAEKVALFRSLFRGREDVFPTRFLNRKSGKPGYAPACSNKFRPGVCGLPRVKCGQCLNQAFVPVGDRVVLDHLKGRHVMGVYALLPDETCWFLASDFDRAGWKEDAAAFVETCRTIGVPVALERSRSGNGAHAWIFFTEPVPAVLARSLGSYLITETMARHHQLGMESYDRLFPNQDTLPHGGFGNLIALPLQYEPRKEGNTVFVDTDLRPYPDQWAFLASVARLDPDTVDAISHEAARRGQVLGVRFVDPDGEDTVSPWARPPSGRLPLTPIPGPLPERVHAVLAQRLFIEKAGLPSPLINQIKRVAAFQNPEFYKKQQMRLSTALTPRVIACAEEFPDHVAVPRGCRGEVDRLLRYHGAALSVDDQRQDGEAVGFTFRGELTPVQERAARELLDHEGGVLVAPPGSGKTVLGTFLIAQRRRSTLVLVHRRPLLEQWVAQLSAFLGIGAKEVGQIGGGRRAPNGKLDVATIQSLVYKGRVDDIVASYGHVIVDECHHVPAASFERLLSEVRARHVVGLTATPCRRDGLHPILEMQLGPVRFSTDPKQQAIGAPFSRRLVVRTTDFQLPGSGTDVGIQEIYRLLTADEARNSRIVEDVLQELKDGRAPILLTERRDHLEYFADQLRGQVQHLIVLQGGNRNPRSGNSAAVSEIPRCEQRLVIATGRYIGEGFDDARLDTLFLAMPISWKGTLVQYAGRLQRLHPDKKELRVFDYVDRDVPVLARMFQKRLRTYRAIGYVRDDAPGSPQIDGLTEL
jgi:superfamily II DNA or RNA helicase